jgi:hypothetical protein
MTGTDSADQASVDRDGASAPAPGTGTPDPSAAPYFPPEEARAGPYVLRTVLVLVAVGVLALAIYFAEARHWLALHTGIINGGPDKYYNFWSGFGSDLGEATLISAVGIGVYTGVRKVNCHTKGCWRIGRHHLDGTPYVLCRHHHPGVPSKGASHEHILEQHRRFQASQAAAGQCPTCSNGHGH